LWFRFIFYGTLFSGEYFDHHFSSLVLSGMCETSAVTAFQSPSIFCMPYVKHFKLRAVFSFGSMCLWSNSSNKMRNFLKTYIPYGFLNLISTFIFNHSYRKSFSRDHRWSSSHPNGNHHQKQWSLGCLRKMSLRMYSLDFPNHWRVSQTA